MKKSFAIVLSAILAGGTLCTIGFAADYGAGQSVTSGQQDLQRQSSAQQIEKKNEFKAASDLDGLQIQNQQGEKIGQIEQVLVDVNQGRLAFVVVRSDVAGSGDQKYIVPWQMIRTSGQQDQLMLNVSSLNQLRPIAAGEPIEQTITRQSGREIFQFYGISPYWEEGGRQPMQREQMQQMPQDQIHRQMMERMHQPERQPIPQTPQ